MFASSGNFSVLKIPDISVSRIILFLLFSEGHGNNQVIHINLLGICFIDTEKW